MLSTGQPASAQPPSSSARTNWAWKTWPITLYSGPYLTSTGPAGAGRHLEPKTDHLSAGGTGATEFSHACDFRKHWPAERAQASSRPPIATHSVARDYFTNGTALLRAGRFAEAEACLREGLSLQPDDADVLNNLGTAVWQQGRVVGGDGVFSQGISVQTRTTLGFSTIWGSSSGSKAGPNGRSSSIDGRYDIQPDSFDTRDEPGRLAVRPGAFRRGSRLAPRASLADPARLGRRLGQRGHDTRPPGPLGRGHEACYDHAISLRPDFGEAQSQSSPRLAGSRRL